MLITIYEQDTRELRTVKFSLRGWESVSSEDGLGRGHIEVSPEHREVYLERKSKLSIERAKWENLADK